MTKLYNDCNSYLRAKFGCKVYRIGLDAGFTCPNRDGKKGVGGCLYCNARASRATYADPAHSVSDQLRTRIAHLKEREGAQMFIAYFQAFSNTYAPPERLKAVYDEVAPFEEVVGISIGTRPDTVDEDKLRLVASYRTRYEVWMEYGLQTIHDRTLDVLNRKHTYADFLRAVRMTRDCAIPVCAHVILGLPGESDEDMLATARELGRMKIDGVKVHLLHVLRGSALETLYREGKVGILSRDRYVKLVCDFLGRLWPGTVVWRLTGEGGRDEHLAPEWALDKTFTLRKIREELERRSGPISSCDRGSWCSSG